MKLINADAVITANLYDDEHEEFIRKHGDIDLLGVFSHIEKIKAVVEAEGEEQ